MPSGDLHGYGALCSNRIVSPRGCNSAKLIRCKLQNCFTKFVCLLWSICNHEIFFLLLSFGYIMFNIISIITQKGPCCIHFNLSIVLTKLIYNTIQTWNKRINQTQEKMVCTWLINSQALWWKNIYIAMGH
jgi:hypothetical protein